MKNTTTCLVAVLLALLCPVLSARAEGTLRGLLLRFDEPAGRRFTDYSGSGHTVSAVGNVTRSVTDKIQGASSVCFSGDGYLQVDPSPDFVFAEDLTIDFWFKSASSERQYALSFGYRNEENNIDFDFADRDGTSPGFWLYWNSGGQNRITGGTRLQYMDGQWHHVAMVRNQGVITAYMDGVSLGKVTYAGTLGSPSHPVRVGVVFTSNGPFYPWRGCIDEVRVINGRALWTSNFDPRLYLAAPLNAFR